MCCRWDRSLKNSFIQIKKFLKSVLCCSKDITNYIFSSDQGICFAQLNSRYIWCSIWVSDFNDHSGKLIQMTNITSVYISPFGKTNILFKVTLRVWGDNHCSLLEKLGIILFVVNINDYRIAKGLVKYGNYHNQWFRIWWDMLPEAEILTVIKMGILRTRFWTAFDYLNMVFICIWGGRQSFISLYLLISHTQCSAHMLRCSQCIVLCPTQFCSGHCVTQPFVRQG